MHNKCKIFAALIAVLTVLSAFSGCSAQSSATAVYTAAEVTQAPSTEADADEGATDESMAATESGFSKTTTANTEQFRDIFDEYAENLRSKTPVLINEFFAEAVHNAENGIDNDSLEHEKETQLLMIFNEGLAEFVKIMNSSDASYSEYDYWENKLQEIYEEQINELRNSCISAGGEDYDY